MNGQPRLSVRRSVAVGTAVALLLVGAGAAFMLLPGRSAGRAPGTDITVTRPVIVPPPAGARDEALHAPLPDVMITLSPEAVERAGIVATPVSNAASSVAVRMPGVVEPNAYRAVNVTPLVSGRVTRVSAELGDHVRRGQVLVQIYSPELAEAQTRYISVRAALGAHDRELERTETLVKIGAASRQELERIHAEHAAQTAEVQSARSRLELLGVPVSTLDGAAANVVNATTTVPAPIAGVVTERLANVGLNVDPSARLFTIVDLSTVWVVADLYERDFEHVRVGTPATVTTTAYPDLVLEGRVSYIDPRVSPDTRTARVRIEVPNPRNDLRLGMYADVDVAGDRGRQVPMIPRTAVQNVGDRSVVYLKHVREPGQFTEREVHLGQASGDLVAIVSGVQPGDLVVTTGSFFLRAERERLGLRPPTARTAAKHQTGPAVSTDRAGDPPVQTARVRVTEQGFEPAAITLRAGAPARLTFVRTTDKTCGTEVVFPALAIRRALPLNEPVAVDFTPAQTGELAFTCGMSMLRGTVSVQ